MAKNLLILVMVIATSDYSFGCDGNFDTVQTCMKANLPNATKVLEQVNRCYADSGCADVSPEVSAPPTKKPSLLAAFMQLITVIFDLNKLQQCHNLIKPIVSSSIETCVRVKYPDYNFPNFTLGQINSSFFGGDLNISFANCSSKAQPAFAKCLNETIGDPLQAVCKAEKTCSQASNENQCTVKDVKKLVSDCAVSELPKQKTELTAAVKKCLGVSTSKSVSIIFSNSTDISGMLIKLIQKMGNWCDDYQQQQSVQQSQSAPNAQSIPQQQQNPKSAVINNQLQNMKNKFTSFIDKLTESN
jgi:hypothetical protein